MTEAYIVGAVRSPIGKKKGKLSSLHPTDLFGAVLKGLLADPNVDSLIVIYIPPLITDPNEIAAAIRAYVAADWTWERAAERCVEVFRT